MKGTVAYRLFAFFAPVLLVLAGMTACSKDEGNCDSDSLQRPIRFTCSPVAVTVKADNSFVSGAGPLVATKQFAVYGWDTGASCLTDDPGTPDFTSTPWVVTFTDNDDKGKNNSYTPGVGDDNTWPRTSGYDYSFAAYYPYGGAGITAPTWTSGTVGVYNFTAQATAASMVDFCVSDVSNDMTYTTTNSGYNGTVQMTFRHALTRVQFKFVKAREVAEDLPIEIVDAKLENVRTTGTLTATYTPPLSPGHGVPGTTTLAWNGLGGDPLSDYEITIGGVDLGPYDAVLPATPTTVEVDYTQTVANSDVFLMVPDEIRSSSNPQKLHFWWRVDGGELTETELNLSDCKQAIGNETLANIAWEANSFVTYTIVIKTTKIDFHDVYVTIAPWPGEDVNGYYPIIL